MTRLLAAVLVLLFAATAHAAAPPARARLLSLREAMALALERDDARDADDPEPAGGARMRRCLRGAVTLQERRALHETLAGVEAAYWDLAGAYWALFVAEWNWRSTGETAGIMAGRVLLGCATTSELEQVCQLAESYREQRKTAVAAILTQEKQLRRQLGLKPGAPLLMPADAPRAVPVAIDRKIDLREALEHLPDVALARRGVEAAEAKGGVALSKARAALAAVEQKAESDLAAAQRQLLAHDEQARANRAQREAFGEQYQARRVEFLNGRGTIDVVLEAQRFAAWAMVNEAKHFFAACRALARYDQARGLTFRRASLEETKTPLRSSQVERRRTAASPAAGGPPGAGDGVTMTADLTPWLRALSGETAAALTR